VTRHSYPIGALAGDYARAAAGLVLAIPPLVLLQLNPVVAAIFALTGKGGSDASIIYRNTADFYDITSGTNRVRTSTRATYLNTAGVGYDGPTGIGTPNGAAFVSAQ